MATIHHAGTPYPVTDAFHAKNTEPWPHLATMTREQLDVDRNRLLALSNDRALTRAERAELAAVTNHYNVRNALHVLGTDAHQIHGFEGVDQLHGNRWIPPCGCELQIVFDHHKAVAGEPHEVHAHKPRFVCEKHAHLEHDWKALHAQVTADHPSEGAPAEAV